MELQVGVKILLKNAEGKYLLVRRSVEKYPEVGNHQWDIVGGRINLGIPLYENLKREINEEVALKLEKEPRLIAAQDILRIPGRHVVRLTYIGEIEGQPKLDLNEHSDFGWFTLEEMKRLEGLDLYFKEVLNSKSEIIEGY
ncbi:MAG: NUDIX domain-containing protein [Candidatus Colwellbacteria bacterium]|nr:NUDIX domain-containing protein [Candidatus Colwellbacteria bacterium]